ncbi:hypothetical protein EUX98_g6350 [Antrodiella citrinella]|uniref:TEA domain-containing protein n=1 Tax=Antrodiella citrinella TaxID=2447956 RepID=A0A4S4MQ15_9APHY|nr:hypothetical protein EUX98_g6350 [Antrodiella citrinella]
MPSSSSSSRNQFAQHVRVSSTEDLSYNIPTGTGGTKDVIQTIVTGRKCWKTMKGRGEVVWPPYLEAALVEGLEQYRPVETRSTRALGRFPMRNKFISDRPLRALAISEYIFKATGKRRTPKQVGSRLQQLRDTCEGKRILKLLSSRPSDSSNDEDDAPSGSAATRTPSTPSPTCDQVTIDVLPADSYWPLGDYGTIPSPHSATSATASTSSANHNASLNTPRPLRTINSTVTFRSGSPVNAYSSFRVLKDGQCIHNEETELEMRSSSCMPAQQWPAEMECIFYYSTRLVPKLWSFLCKKNDLNAYSIVQDIIRTVPTPQEGDASSPAPTEVILSIVYYFKTFSSTAYSGSRSHSPASTVVSADADNMSYSTESTPDIGGEFDEFLTTLHDNHQAGQPYAHHGPSPHLTAVLPPFHALQSRLQNSAGYELPPDLIRDGEEGYTSLPPSPLDFAFPAAISSGHVVPTNVVVADTSAGDLSGGLDISGGYVGVPVDSQHQGCYAHDILNVGVQGNVSMMPWT